MVLVAAAWSALALASPSVLPAGGTVTKSLGVDVSPKGIDFLLAQGLTLMPSEIQVPTDSGSQSCLLDTLNYSIYPGPASNHNGVNITINSASLVPTDGGVFTFAIAGVLTGTGTDTPLGTSNVDTDVVADIQYSGCATSCDAGDGHSAVLQLSPMNFSVASTLSLSLTTDATGKPVVTAATPLSDSDITLDTSKLGSDGCDTIDIILAVVKDFIGNQVKNELINEVNQNLIPTIESGLAGLQYDQDLTLLGSAIHAKIQPSTLSITHDGMVLGMSSAIDAVAPTTCVPIPAGAGSDFTPNGFPTFGTSSPGGLNFDAAVALSQDLADQALFAVWHGGLLCQTLSNLGGTPITTTILGIAGLTPSMNDLGVPAGSPAMIMIRGLSAPTAAFGGAHPVNVNVSDLELSVFTMVDQRMARLVALDLDLTAGVDLTVTSGSQLSFGLSVDPSNFTATESYDELIGSAGASQVIAALPSLLSVVGPQLGGALPTLNLGNLGGIGLVSPEFDVQQSVGGVPNDTLAAYANLAAAPGGCSSGGGCGISSGSCSIQSQRDMNGVGVMLGLFAVPLAFVALRRRRG